MMKRKVQLINFMLMGFIFLLVSSCKDSVTENTPVDNNCPNGVCGTAPVTPPPQITQTQVKVLKVKALVGNGTFYPGDEIRVGVELSSAVKVTGTPKLSLKFDQSVQEATYVADSDETTLLKFVYKVQEGDETSELQTTGADSLGLTGVTLTPSLSNAVLQIEMPDEGSAKSLSSNAAIKVTYAEFSRHELSSKWTYIDRDGWDADGDGFHNNDADLVAHLHNQSLRLLAGGSDFYGNKHFFSGIMQEDFSGDFDYELKVESLSVVHSLTKVGFAISNDLQNLALGGNVHCMVTASNGLLLQYASGNNGKINKRYYVGASSFPVWLRLQKVGNTFSCFYKHVESDPWTLHSHGAKAITSIGQEYDLGIVLNSRVNLRAAHAVLKNFKEVN